MFFLLSYSHLDTVRALAFHPLELCLATGSDDYTLKIWRLTPSDLSPGAPTMKVNSDTEPQITYRGHTAPITRIVISAKKGLVYTASLDSTIHVWAIPPAVLPCYAPYNPSRSRGVLVGHTDAVWDLALTREDSILISCGAEGLVKVWSLTGNGIGSLKLSWGFDGTEATESDRTEEIGATAVEPIKTDLKKIAVAYQNSVVKLFNLETGGQLGVFSIDPGTGTVMFLNLT
jgi:striatin 1/3/4